MVSELPHPRAFQSLWAMEDLPHGRPPGVEAWPLRRQVELVAEAGYAGIALDTGARRRPAPDDLAAAVEGTGLQTAVFAFVASDQDLAAALECARVIGARDMVVCAQLFDVDPVRDLRRVESWHRTAADAGVRMQLETHRNTLTNDLRVTSRLLDDLDPGIDIALDLSHYICGAEIPDVPSDEVEHHIARLCARAGSVQARVATRCQVQVPLHFPSSTPWIDLARRWWQQGMSSILARGTPPADVMFVTELGTAPYALTDVDGRQLSDRWEEALTLLRWGREALAQALSPTA